ncbi:MAG: hypothetical protein CMD01_02820 [Flavobacteriales bacterium]|nr:hypothetical protein [Flavobacteriales bacterium]
MNVSYSLLGLLFFKLFFSGFMFSQQAGKSIDDSIDTNLFGAQENISVLDSGFLPAFAFSSLYFKKRYKEEHLLKKIVDNKGDGFDSLYGTRNMRPILHGVAYRGGANNYFHKTQKRKNNNPLPNDGVLNLCREGFSSSVYLYKSNWDSSFSKNSCSCVNNTLNNLSYYQLNYFDSIDVDKMIHLVYNSALDSSVGPVYLHCWNGWHASGFIAAILLKQFCGYSSLDAVNYWDLCTDGTNISPRYNFIRDKIKAFKPIQKYTINDSLGNLICPPMPEIIDSNLLHISIEHLKLVPEALPDGTILILDNIRFQPNQTNFSNPEKNKDLILLSDVLLTTKNLTLEISGHTDRSGDESKNKLLSKKRAKFIYDYLLKNGASENQLSYKGMGSLMPAYTNKTKEGRSANRRIEIKILKNQKEDYSTLVKETELTFFSKLTHLKPNNAIVLNEIRFNPSEYLLSANQIDQLDSLAAYLRLNNASVEIIGYTDASGVEEKNIVLSGLRAQSAYSYIIDKGVEAKRLFFSGCGSANPIAPNKYEWGREKNRRLEVVLLKK